MPSRLPRRMVPPPLPHAQGGAGHPLLLPQRAGRGEESAAHLLPLSSWCPVEGGGWCRADWVEGGASVGGAAQQARMAGSAAPLVARPPPAQCAATPSPPPSLSPRPPLPTYAPSTPTTLPPRTHPAPLVWQGAPWSPLPPPPSQPRVQAPVRPLTWVWPGSDEKRAAGKRGSEVRGGEGAGGDARSPPLTRARA